MLDEKVTVTPLAIVTEAFTVTLVCEPTAVTVIAAVIPSAVTTSPIAIVSVGAAVNVIVALLIAALVTPVVPAAHVPLYTGTPVTRPST